MKVENTPVLHYKYGPEEDGKALSSIMQSGITCVFKLESRGKTPRLSTHHLNLVGLAEITQYLDNSREIEKSRLN